MSILTQPDVTAFFGEALSAALTDEGVKPSHPTRAYLVEVLASRASRPAEGGPITLALGEALDAPPRERFEKLKDVGDRSLTESGLFADSLQRRGVDPAYVERVGQQAYVKASCLLGSPDGLDLFGELARELPRIVRALREVANLLFAGSPSDQRGVLRAYERWERTGSPGLARSLAMRGLVPLRGGGLAH